MRWELLERKPLHGDCAGPGSVPGAKTRDSSGASKVYDAIQRLDAPGEGRTAQEKGPGRGPAVQRLHGAQMQGRCPSALPGALIAALKGANSA